jgi:hypothetical protein
MELHKFLLCQNVHRIDLNPQVQNSIARQTPGFVLPTILEECKMLCDTAQKALISAERAERVHGKLRDKFLQQPANQCSECGDLTAAQWLKWLKQCESTARVF